MANARILVISDLHMPYCHPDTWKFLERVKAKYKPDKVVCIGDELDHHAMSFHTSNPSLDSASREMERAINLMKKIFKLFPDVDVLESNHGSLVYRRAMDCGIPANLIIPYRDQIQAPKGWRWHFDLTITMSNGQKVYFHHGKTGGQGKLSQRQSMCAVQGHFHSKFHITYWANPTALFWDAHIGCLADSKSLAMEYGKNSIEKGIVGCLMILKGHPHLVPMVLKSNGRWNGEVL